MNTEICDDSWSTRATMGITATRALPWPLERFQKYRIWLKTWHLINEWLSPNELKCKTLTQESKTQSFRQGFLKIPWATLCLIANGMVDGYIECIFFLLQKMDVIEMSSFLDFRALPVSECNSKPTALSQQPYALLQLYAVVSFRWGQYWSDSRTNYTVFELYSGG